MNRILSVLLLIGACALLGCSGTQSQTSTEYGGGEDVSVEILAPKDGATIEGSTVEVKVRVLGVELVPGGNENNPREGHLHYTLDGIGQMTDKVETKFEGVEPGEHRLTAEIGANDHGSRVPQVLDTVTFEVSEP